MKKTVLVLLMLIVVGSLTSGCTSETAETIDTEPVNTETDTPTADTVATYTVSGTYSEMIGEGIMYKNSLFFKIDEGTAPSVLTDATTSNSVRFSNQEEAKEMFELNDEEVFTADDENQKECRIEGIATIEFSNFKTGKPETDDTNSVKLEKVISKEPYTKTCEPETNNEGTITLSGKYREYEPNTLLGGALCFYPDDATKYLIPDNKGDDKIAWFCFENQESAKEILGINDSEIFNDTTTECIEGLATIEISNYTIASIEAAVPDKATLGNIISKEFYSTTCK